jgi:hypothetical protein
MMKQLYIFALAQIVSIAPALASVPSDLPTAGDKQKLSALETQFFTHEDVNRNLNQRLDNVESFVFGATTTGSFHQRLARISDTCSKEQTAAAKPEPRASRAMQPSQPTTVAHQPVRVQTFPSLTTYEFDDREAITSRPTVHFQRASAVRQSGTVVDRIECLEMSIFGRKDCGGKLQKRVAKLENSVYGAKDSPDSAPSITDRVNKLWSAVNAS